MRLFLICVLLFPSFAWGEEVVVPPQRIVGAEAEISLGDLVDLSLSQIQTKPKHFVDSAATWTILELPTGQTGDLPFGRVKRVKEYNGGVFFGSGIQPTRLKVICSIVYLYIVKDDKGVVLETLTRNVLLTADLTVGKVAPPTPPVPPVPPTPPTPPAPLPDKRFSLASPVRDAAVASVKDRDRLVRGSAAIAKVYRTVTKQIAAGVLPKDVDVLAKTLELTNTTLKETLGSTANPDWKNWGTLVEDRLYVLYSANKIVSVTDYQDAWEEIATGLEAVK